MLTVGAILAGLAIVGGGPVVGLWVNQRRKSAARNRDGACAHCGVAWQDVEEQEPFLIHGRLVCAPCAARARRRLPWEFGVLGFATGGATFLTFLGKGAAAMVLFPVASMAVMTTGAVVWMKHANRDAQRRIALGEYPDFEALRDAPPRRALDDGTTEAA